MIYGKNIVAVAADTDFKIGEEVDWLESSLELPTKKSMVMRDPDTNTLMLKSMIWNR